MNNYADLLNIKLKTKELETVSLVDGKYHKRILYVSIFGMPQIVNFCGQAGEIEKIKFGVNNCTCKNCKSMTLQDAIDRIEKQVPKVVDIVELDNEDCIDIVKDKEYFYEKFIRFNETYFNACKNELDGKLDDTE